MATTTQRHLERNYKTFNCVLRIGVIGFVIKTNRKSFIHNMSPTIIFIKKYFNVSIKALQSHQRIIEICVFISNNIYLTLNIRNEIKKIIS